MENNRQISKLVIFSGLPGVGKSTLADRLVQVLRWPLLRIDDLVIDIPADVGPTFWDEKVSILLTLAETQLSLGLSVIVDSIFMGLDRVHAQELARKYGAAFRPVYCFISDETLWRQRVTQRVDMFQNPAVATWERVLHQREYFEKWDADTGLFVDAVVPIEQNNAKVQGYVTGPSAPLKPLLIPAHGLKKGHYHA